MLCAEFWCKEEHDFSMKHWQVNTVEPSYMEHGGTTEFVPYKFKTEKKVLVRNIEEVNVSRDI